MRASGGGFVVAVAVLLCGGGREELGLGELGEEREEEERELRNMPKSQNSVAHMGICATER